MNEEEEQKKIEEKKEKIVKEEEKEEEDESNPTQSKRKPKFKTHIAKSVYYTLFLSSIPESTEAFLPGRTCLIFNLVSKNEPDIIMRSAEKFSPLKQPIVDPLDDLLIEKIKDTIHNPPQKKPKVQPQPQLVKKSNSEEDIFADAGDYIPTNSTSQVKPKLIQSYFDKPEKLEPMETYISELPVGLQRQLESAKKYVSIHGTDQAETEIEETTLSLHELRQKELTSKKRKARPQDISVDSYSECFPGTYEGNFAEYEDEEDDISKMDMGGKNKLHRRDFTSQEAWSSYNDNREALPRAAFQFGVKMNDGRKTKKNTEKTKEKKLEKELKKINTIIKEKENARHTQVPTAEEARKRLKLT